MIQLCTGIEDTQKKQKTKNNIGQPFFIEYLTYIWSRRHGMRRYLAARRSKYSMCIHILSARWPRKSSFLDFPGRQTDLADRPCVYISSDHVQRNATQRNATVRPVFFIQHFSPRLFTRPQQQWYPAQDFHPRIRTRYVNSSLVPAFLPTCYREGKGGRLALHRYSNRWICMSPLQLKAARRTKPDASNRNISDPIRETFALSKNFLRVRSYDRLNDVCNLFRDLDGSDGTLMPGMFSEETVVISQSINLNQSINQLVSLNQSINLNQSTCAISRHTVPPSTSKQKYCS